MSYGFKIYLLLVLRYKLFSPTIIHIIPVSIQWELLKLSLYGNGFSCSSTCDTHIYLGLKNSFSACFTESLFTIHHDNIDWFQKKKQKIIKS